MATVYELADFVEDTVLLDKIQRIMTHFQEKLSELTTDEVLDWETLYVFTIAYTDENEVQISGDGFPLPEQLFQSLDESDVLADITCNPYGVHSYDYPFTDSDEQQYEMIVFPLH